jgi:hypothetical protein
MNYAIKRSSGALIYIQSFVYIDSVIQNVIRRTCIHSNMHTDSKAISKAYFHF